MIAGIIICLFLLPGCNQRVESELESNNKFYVGVIVPTEGSLWLYGRECLKGLNLAINECNEAGGVKGRELALKVENNAGDPLRSAEAVKSFASDSTVIAVIGPVTSNNSLAAATVAQHEEIPLLMPYATNPPITEVGDFISRICFTDISQARTLAKYTYFSLGIKRVAILYEKGNNYSEALATYFQREFTSLGGEVCETESYTAEDKTYLTSLQNIFLKKPDAIFMPAYYPQATQMLHEVASLGENTVFLGGDGWESIEKTELPAEVLNDEFQIYITSHFSSEDIRPTTQHFVQRYEQIYQSSPNALSALAYDAGLLVIDALKRANQSNRKALKEAINGTREFPGATGKISLNEKRNAVKPVFILEIRGGEFHLRASDVPML